MDKDAYDFIGDYKTLNPMLDISNPVTYGAQAEENWHFEHKAKQHKAIMESPVVIKKIFEEFESKTNRRYRLLETYILNDADVAIVAIGTTVESCILAAKQIRKEEGIKAGVIGIRVLRPFQFETIKDVTKNLKAIACLDRSSPAGALGMVFNEVSSALQTTHTKTITNNYIYGLGGRDITINDIKNIYRDIHKNAKSGILTTPLQQFVGLRGPKLSFY